jgi:uncharacterized delta-60 repeat protein
MAGEMETAFTIPLLDDGLVEGDKTIELSLSDPLNRFILSPSTNLTLHIRDDEKPGVRLDLRFTPDIAGYTAAQVVRFRPAPDEKVIAELQFADESGSIQARLLRLNGDGTRDGSFQAPAENLTLFAVQPDGRVLCVSSNRVIRLEQDGAIDAGFQVTVDLADEYAQIRKILVQPDGKILILGRFTAVLGVERTKLARLDPDGSLDMDFVPSAAFEGYPEDMVVTTEGSIFVGSYEANGISIVKLNADGSLDPTFAHTQTGFWGLGPLVLQPDGKILLTTFTGGRYYRPQRCLGSTQMDRLMKASAQATCSLGNMSALVRWRLRTTAAFFWSGLATTARTRIHPTSKNDGHLDRSFEPSVGPEGSLNAIHLVNEDYALVGGRFRFTTESAPRNCAHSAQGDGCCDCRLC